MEVYDIDEILGKTKFSIKLGGNTYELIDLPLDLFLKEQSKAGTEFTPADMKKYLAKCFNIDEKELNGVGVFGLQLATKRIQEWMRERSDLVSSKNDEVAKSPRPSSDGGKQ